jgi:hypothetical protein
LSRGERTSGRKDDGGECQRAVFLETAHGRIPPEQRRFIPRDPILAL